MDDIDVDIDLCCCCSADLTSNAAGAGLQQAILDQSLPLGQSDKANLSPVVHSGGVSLGTSGSTDASSGENRNVGGRRCAFALSYLHDIDLVVARVGKATKRSSTSVLDKPPKRQYRKRGSSSAVAPAASIDPGMIAVMQGILDGNAGELRSCYFSRLLCCLAPQATSTPNGAHMQEQMRQMASTVMSMIGSGLVPGNVFSPHLNPGSPSAVGAGATVTPIMSVLTPSGGNLHI